jgi:hypothetical protein
MVEVFNSYATFLFYVAVAFPLIGGTILYMGLQLAKVPDFTFVRCWKIYLAGLCYGYLVIMGTVLLLNEPMPVFQTVLFYVIPMVAIPLLGREYSKRTIAVEIAVIILANSIMLGLGYYAVYSSEKNPSAPAESIVPRQIVPKAKSESQNQKKLDRKDTENTEKKSVKNN